MSASDSIAPPVHHHHVSTPQQTAATSKAQLHQQPTPSQPSQPSQTTTPVQSVAQANDAGDSLTCQWNSCGERCATAEQLYDHVCERHVGRKSTNNLNLDCHWGTCRTATIKRDHITSHIRVHVPLKPHKCDFCGKAFKRPQDLKKHVKTHADDSVLLRSPEPGRATHNGPGAGYARSTLSDTKLVQDLQTLAATASGFYPQHGLGADSSYYNTNGQSSYQTPPAAPSGSAYGPVYYAVNGQSLMNNDYEIRKRAALDALNDFFGDAKRRLIDPTTYYDVGQRLVSLQGVQLPMIGGGGGGGGYSSDTYGGGMTTASLPQQHYQLRSLPNLRTKSDLATIDQFLEQLQHTVYESSNNAAAAGVAQPGTHYVPVSAPYGNSNSNRSSNSPPSVGHAHHRHATSVGKSHANNLAPLATPPMETPALTPASSVMSYTSNAAHSPRSVHSGHSPIRASMGGAVGGSSSSSSSMYPTLPAVSAMDGGGTAGYSTAGASAATSSLGSGFDADGRRRYSGGLLQRAAPPPPRPHEDAVMEDSPTPKTLSDVEAEVSLARETSAKMNIVSPSMIDPAMRSPGAARSDADAVAAAAVPSPGAQTEAEDERQRMWIENVRMIEMLREFVNRMLELEGFGEDGDGEAGKEGADVDMVGAEGAAAGTREKSEHERDSESLYPVLRALRDV